MLYTPTVGPIVAKIPASTPGLLYLNLLTILTHVDFSMGRVFGFLELNFYNIFPDRNVSLAEQSILIRRRISETLRIVLANDAQETHL